MMWGVYSVQSLNVFFPVPLTILVSVHHYWFEAWLAARRWRRKLKVLKPKTFIVRWEPIPVARIYR